MNFMIEYFKFKIKDINLADNLSNLLFNLFLFYSLTNFSYFIKKITKDTSLYLSVILFFIKDVESILLYCGNG